MTAEPEPEPMHEPTEGRVTRSASIYLVSQILSWLVTLMAVSVIPRTLGKFVYDDIMTASTATGTVTAFFLLGIDQYLVKEVGRDRKQTEHLLRAALGLRLLLVIPAALGAYLMLRTVADTPLVWTLGLFGIASIPLIYLSAPLRSTLAGWEEARRVSLFDLASVASPLLAIPFLRYGAVPLSISGLMMLAVSLTLAVVWVGRRVRLLPVVDVPLWKRIVQGSLPFLLNNFIVQIYSLVTLFQLKHFADKGALGVYSQAYKLFGTFLFVPTALGAALLPSLARLAFDSPEEFRRKQTRVLSLLIIIGLPVTAGIMALAKPISLLLYGPFKFTEMPQVLPIYALAIIPMYVVTTMYQFLVAQNRNALWGAFLIATIGLYAAVSALSIPLAMRTLHNGAVGAVAATFIAETASACAAFVLLRNNPFNAETISRTLRALVATLCMAAVMVLTNRLYLFAPLRFRYSPFVLLPSLAVPFTLGLATFVLLAWRLKVLMPEEQEKIVALVQRKLHRA